MTKTKRNIIFFLCFTLVIISVLFSSCDKKKSDLPQVTNPFVYEVSTEEKADYDISSVLSIDESWQKAYALSYEYYDSNTGKSTITEGRCDNYYQSVDKASSTICYVTTLDGSILEYMLNGETKTGTVTVAGVGEIDSATSGFCLLSKVDPLFSQYKNVQQVGTDFVAKRPATRYKQVEKQNGKDVKIAYVWLDDQYGFASRCELYDAVTEKLLMSWCIDSFTTNVKQEDVEIDLTKFKIETKVG